MELLHHWALTLRQLLLQWSQELLGGRVLLGEALECLAGTSIEPSIDWKAPRCSTVVMSARTELITN